MRVSACSDNRPAAAHGRPFKPLRAASFIALLGGFLSLGFSQLGWSQAAAIDVGEAELYPSVTISYVTNDNIFASREDAEESSGVKVEPRLVYVADKGASGLELGYAGNYLNSDISEANYADHRLFFSGKAALSKRSELRSDITFDAGHLDFGNSVSRGEVSRTLIEPFTYNEFRFNTAFRYGARRARGNAVFGLAARQRSFTNEPDPANPNRTDGLNFTRITPYFVFSTRLSGDTRAFLDLRFDTVDYDAFANANTAELDNQRIRAYVGSSWDITERTGGSVKVGTIDIDFDDARREDDQIVGFELDAFYSIKRYSKLEFGITREQATATDSTLLGRRDFIDLRWLHEWSTQVDSRFGVQYRTTFSACEDEPGVAGRENNDVTFSGDIDYKFRRWLSLGLGYRFDNGKSDSCPGDDGNTRDYERNIINAHIIVTL